MPLVNFRKKNSLLFLRFLPEFWSSNIFAVTEHTRNQIFLERYPKTFFFKMFTWVLLDGFLNNFSKIRFLIVEICIFIWDFWVIFENYSMRMLSIRGNDLSHTEHTRKRFKRFHRTLSIRRSNFRVCSASGKMLTVFTCTAMLSIRGKDFIAPWAYEEMILSHPEHTRKWFYRTLSIRGNV